MSRGYFGGLEVVRLKTKEDYQELFDCDFTENEEYYREDTLDLGYKNEAERVIEECTREDGTVDIDKVMEIAFRDKDYYTDMAYEVLTLYEDEKEVKAVAFSYMYYN